MEADNKQEIIDAIKTIKGHVAGIRKSTDVLIEALMKVEDSEAYHGATLCRNDIDALRKYFRGSHKDILYKLRERAIKELGDAAL